VHTTGDIGQIDERHQRLVLTHAARAKSFAHIAIQFHLVCFILPISLFQDKPDALGRAHAARFKRA
jgi:hypothetical protein